MNKEYDVVALGELLIDFTQNGMSDQGNPLFEANPGGAPCNVLAMLNKLDKRCAFIGKVGAQVLLKRAPEGTGVIAGGCARAVVELAGIKNIRTKSLGSNNKQNVVFATLKALEEIKTPEEVARLRGKSVEEILA